MKKQLLGALVMAGTSLMISSVAFAQDSECMTDADCPMDYTCEEVGAYDCAEPPPCPGDGSECPSGDEEPVCESGVIMACVPPPPEQCDPSLGANACGDGLTCVSYTFESCSGGGAVPIEGDDSSTGSEGGADDERCVDGPDGTRCEGDGEPGEDVSCMTETESYCVPPYFAPCEVDADCGPGFTCEAEEVCSSCAVEATCTVDEDGNEVCEESPSECEPSCEATGTNYCQLVETTCESDADCATGMVCETFGAEDIGAPAICEVDEDGNEMCEDAPAPEPVSLCLPADWERWVGGYGAQPGSDDVAAGGYDEAIAEASGRDEESWDLVDTAAPGQNGEDDGGAGGDADGDEEEEEEDQGGCQSAGGNGGTGLGLLAALGMMFGLRRRKR